MVLDRDLNFTSTGKNGQTDMTRISRVSHLVLVSGLSLGLLAAPGCGGDQTGTSSSSTGTGTGGAAGSGMGGMGGAGAAGGSGGTGGAPVCNAGDTQPCYGGPAGTEGVGECKGGTKACVSGQWDATCAGEVLPSGAADVCDGKDEDCNGSVDDGIPQISCGKGSCTVTVDGCSGGVVPECMPLPPPSPVETCDGTDDNCDGQIDEGCTCTDGSTQPCYSGGAATKGVGECKAGTQTCAGGAWGACVGEVLPADESCNGKDDDCDGQTDENLGQTSCGAGACFVTVENCVNGVPQPCTPRRLRSRPAMASTTTATCSSTTASARSPAASAPARPRCPRAPAASRTSARRARPMPEQCDGVDNDCDGTVDDGNPGGGSACMTGQQGVCAAGIYAARTGALACNQNDAALGRDLRRQGRQLQRRRSTTATPAAGWPATRASSASARRARPACTAGAIVCNQNEQPTAEICDGLDNNCNGAIDEGNPGGGTACSTGNRASAPPGTLCLPRTARSTCIQTNQPSAEICDGLDNNCNGTSRRGQPRRRAALHDAASSASARPAPSVPGRRARLHPDEPAGRPRPATALDNDCNGTIDDGNPGGGAACSTGQLGVCAAGTTTCSNGRRRPATRTSRPRPRSATASTTTATARSTTATPAAARRATPGQLGVCAAGTTACSAGVALVHRRRSRPRAEICDGKDNDCNGDVDDGNPGGGVACSTGKPGVCAPGHRRLHRRRAGLRAQNGRPRPRSATARTTTATASVDDGNPGGGARVQHGFARHLLGGHDDVHGRRARLRRPGEPDERDPSRRRPRRTAGMAGRSARSGASASRRRRRGRTVETRIRRRIIRRPRTTSSRAWSSAATRASPRCTAIITSRARSSIRSGVGSIQLDF